MAQHRRWIEHSRQTLRFRIPERGFRILERNFILQDEKRVGREVIWCRIAQMVIGPGEEDDAVISVDGLELNDGSSRWYLYDMSAGYQFLKMDIRFQSSSYAEYQLLPFPAHLLAVDRRSQYELPCRLPRQPILP